MYQYINGGWAYDLPNTHSGQFFIHSRLQSLNERSKIDHVKDHIYDTKLFIFDPWPARDGLANVHGSIEQEKCGSFKDGWYTWVTFRHYGHNVESLFFSLKR